MTRWPLAFYAAAATWILLGVSWGVAMSISHDHATSPAHAHLNLLGWVSQALMGVFYATLGQRTPRWLVAGNFVILNIGVAFMIGGLFMLLSDRAPLERLIPFFLVGELGVVAGFAAFAGAVYLALVRSFRRPAAAGAPASGLLKAA